VVDITKLKGKGKSLYIAVSQSKYSNKEAAQRAGYKENTFYKHIRDEDLDLRILAKYDKAINHDFSIQYPEILEYKFENPSETAAKESKAYAELNRKYTALLEKHNTLSEDYNKLYKEFILLKNNKK